jgi:BirA family biotin operon repressor/biotin-[acetyl-CoA-carboxylase] ligase
MTARLDADRIRQPIDASSRSRLDVLEVFGEIGSTNSYLLAEPPPPAGHFRVALAEHQTDGRGRRDREWVSPESTGVCLSLAYTFASTPANLPCITLATGTAVAIALEALGIRGIGLKWPNDLVLGDGKLGGILTELRTSHGEGTTVVVGVGINVDLSATPASMPIAPRIGYASDLSMGTTSLPSRNVISSKLIEAIFNALARYESDGFAPFCRAWDRFDWLRGQKITVETPGGDIEGVAEGIDDQGALVLRTATGRLPIVTGSIYLSGQRRLH